MSDIVIHHCTLSIVRHGGWSWGENPRQLLAGAVRALPQLIADKLAKLWPDDSDVEIAAALRLQIPLRIDELLHAANESARISLNNGDTTGLLEQRVEQAVTALVEQTCGRSAIDMGANAEPDFAEPDKVGSESAPDELSAGSVLRVLLEWRRQNALPSRLVLFSPAALEAWYENLLKSDEAISELDGHTSEAKLAALASEILSEPILVLLGRQKSLIQRILVAVAAIATFKIFPTDSVLRKVLDTFVPIPAPDRVNLSTENHSASIGNQEGAVPFHAPSEIHQVPGQARIVFDVHVPSALPFLLLGPLSRVGYLDAVAATLQAARLTSEFGTFAVALAYKVLDPPERGWFHRPETRAIAAAFAGVYEEVPDPRLADLARGIASHFSPLNALISGALTDGHRGGQPVLLHKASIAEDDGYLLVDSDGIFPIAWVEKLPHLFPYLARLQQSIVLVPQTTVEGELLGQLNDSEFKFMTDAPPSRGEEWQRITNLPGQRMWTNYETGPSAELLRAAQKFDYTAEETKALWHALTVERHAFPVGSPAALEASMALAVSLALGTIAWTLWKDREPVTPLLALERFRDLDAHVRFDEHSVKVRLPLGKRHRDLFEHDLLRDVGDVPWFAGRVLQFSGG